MFSLTSIACVYELCVYYVCVCVHACVRACVRASVRVCVWIEQQQNASGPLEAVWKGSESSQVCSDRVS